MLMSIFGRALDHTFTYQDLYLVHCVALGLGLAAIASLIPYGGASCALLLLLLIISNRALSSHMLSFYTYPWMLSATMLSWLCLRRLLVCVAVSDRNLVSNLGFHFYLWLSVSSVSLAAWLSPVSVVIPALAVLGEAFAAGFRIDAREGESDTSFLHGDVGRGLGVAAVPLGVGVAFEWLLRRSHHRFSLEQYGHDPTTQMGSIGSICRRTSRALPPGWRSTTFFSSRLRPRRDSCSPSASASGAGELF